MYKVFIDGREGTTGLRIFERLEKREDVEITVLPEELRKDPGARSEAINGSDAAFLCLPDAAAVQSAEMVKNSRVRIFEHLHCPQDSGGLGLRLPGALSGTHGGG